MHSLLKWGLLTIFIITPESHLFAHSHMHHSTEETKFYLSSDIIQKVSVTYIEKIEPIFKAKCFDCHSTQTKYPWYHAIPGIRQFIDGDVKDGLGHIDFTPGYPFRTKHSPLEILTGIKKIAIKNSMPPIEYKIMHWKSSLTKKEREKILEWVNSSRRLIEKQTTKEK